MKEVLIPFTKSNVLATQLIQEFNDGTVVTVWYLYFKKLLQLVCSCQYMFNRWSEGKKNHQY